MKGRCVRKMLSAVAMLLVVPLVVAVVGCGGNGGGVVVMMKRLSRNVSELSFTDVKALRVDKDLDEVYEDFKENVEAEFEELGLSLDDVDGIARGGSVTILDGRFDLEGVREELDDNDYDDDEYNGVETWEGDLSVALVSGTCIVAAFDIEGMKGCVDVINGGKDSLYDDENLRDVIGEVPGGLTTVGYLDLENGPYEGLRSLGASIIKRDSDTVQMTAVYLFEDEDAAERAESSIEDAWKDAENVRVSQDGVYIRATADDDLEEAFGIW